jgi:diguanylate cyclase (GGDEF)-like protein/PAS domain S-box-containing protein
MNASEAVQPDRAEKSQLKELLALHEAALASMSHGLSMVDAEQRLVLYNQRFLEMYELSPEVARVGMPMAELIAHSAERGNFPVAQLEEIKRRRLDMMARGKPFRLLRQMSRGRTFAMDYRPLADGGWVTLVEDVTERQRNEYGMRVQFERFDQAVTHMSHGLCAVDSDHRIVLFNKLFLEMYGLSEDVIRVGVWMRDVIEHVAARDYFPEATPERIWQRRLEKMAAGKPFQQRQKLRNGRDYVLHYHPMADGGWVTLCEDVTERHSMERELRMQYERFDQAVNHMSHGLCMFGPDERLIACNAQYLEIYKLDPAVAKPGASQREVLALWVESLDEPGMTADAYYEKRKRGAASGELSSMRLHLKDGRVIEATTRPTPDGGWVTAHEDVTERISYEKTLREQNILFDAALENMAHGLCVFDKDWRVVVRNRRYLELYDLGPNDALPGTPLMELMRQSIDRGMHTAKLSAEKFFADFIKRITVDREPVVFRRLTNGRLLAVRHEPLENGSWVGTYEDITERERAADELKEQHRRFDVALNNMAHGLCMFDESMHLIVSNKRYAEMFGLPQEFVRPGMPIREIIEASFARGNYRHKAVTADELYSSYVASLNAGDLIVHRHLSDGRIIKLTHERMPKGGWVAIYEDVTERHRAEESIAHMARHDALTQLPNRVLLREKMAEGLARVESAAESMAVFYLDLDNFKGVNDTLGHPIGDKLLGIIAERVRGAVGEGDTIARLGGDEFAVLQCNSSAVAAGALARALVEIISEPIEIDGQEINSGVSIGIALAPDDGSAADHLMKCADLALYRAKAEGRGTFRFFEPDMDARIQARRALEVDLRRALQAGEFSLHYQPQINLATNELTVMEALLRWTHAERGSVPPSEFIPLAEEMGLIVPLGEWVLREACLEAARWPDPIKVAVNLSPVQFRNRGLVTTVTHALAAARLAPHRLELEITEAVLLQDDEAIVTMLHRLRALGVRIAMDDFGTGYSSLSYLRSFPFDKIKIDRSFIKDIDRNRDSAVIIKAIASLGQSLGIETTAEGIETEEQLDIVRRAGCTEMQGYLVSKPVPAHDLGDLIARFRSEEKAA